MLARDPADGVGQVAESGPMHELGDRRYKRRRLQIALHDVRPFIGCDGALRRCGGRRHLSGGAGNQSATRLEEAAAERLLPTDRLVPRPIDVGVRCDAARSTSMPTAPTGPATRAHRKTSVAPPKKR